MFSALCCSLPCSLSLAPSAPDAVSSLHIRHSLITGRSAFMARGGLSGWSKEGRMLDFLAGALESRSLPKDDVAAGARMGGGLRPSSISEVSRTPDRQPAPVQ